MKPMFLPLLAAASQSTLTILFVGNSHTSYNDMPGMVRNLLVSGGQYDKVTTKPLIGALLNDQAKNPAVKAEISSGKWKVVVLQGATVSSSHKYKYKQDGGIELANLARKAKSRVLLFAEWPRKGWDEAQYIMKVYEEIARPSQAEIVPIPWVFRRAFDRDNGLDLWQPDGNHATQTGTYLGALTLYYWISEQHFRPAKWAPKGFSSNLMQQLDSEARAQHRLNYPD